MRLSQPIAVALFVSGCATAPPPPDSWALFGLSSARASEVIQAQGFVCSTDRVYVGAGSTHLTLLKCDRRSGVGGCDRIKLDVTSEAKGVRSVIYSRPDVCGP